MASPSPSPLPPRPFAASLAELIERQRTLALYGCALLVLALRRRWRCRRSIRALLDSGVNVWVKPAKFLVSVGIFALTAAWFFGYVRPERRRAPMLRATVAMLIVAGTFELAWIGWQAAHGLESHFNNDTPFFSIMYAADGAVRGPAGRHDPAARLGDRPPAGRGPAAAISSPRS